MKRQWFQPHKVAPHYDLTASRRSLAVQLGAIEVGRKEASQIWKSRREAIALQSPVAQVPAGEQASFEDFSSN